MARDSDEGATAREAMMVARQAMRAIEEHQRDCTQFRRDLRESQERSHRERQDMHQANQNAIHSIRVQAGIDTLSMRAHVSDRTKGIYRLLWTMVLSVIGFLALAAWQLLMGRLPLPH